MSPMVAELLPERLAPLLAEGLPPAVAARLLSDARLGPRARAFAAGVLGDVAAAIEALTPGERLLAEAPGRALSEAATLAGAVWHAPRVRGLLLAKEVAAFAAALAEAARRAALRHGALAPGGIAVPRDLEAAIREDGAACLTAWLDSLPRPLAARLRLRLPLSAEGVPEALHRAHGPAILRAVAAEVVA